MTVDVPTLLVMIILVCLTLSFSVLVVDWRIKAYRGLVILGWSLVLLALSIAAFGLRLLGWQLTSIILSNGLTSLVLALLLLAVQQFQHTRFRPLTPWLVWLPVAAGLLTAITLTGSPQWRTLVLALLWCFQSILLAREVARPVLEREMEQGRILLLTGCGILILLFTVRGILSAIHVNWDTPLSIPEPIVSISYLASLCAILVTTMGYVLMQMEWAIQLQQRQALEDPLTGAANRRALMAQLDRSISQAERNGSTLSMLMIDIDFFKKVNDSHGHKVGDVVLMELADRLRQRMRAQDFLARFGGEEFIAVLPETDRQGAAVVAEDIRRAVEERPFVVGDLEIPITVSVGVSSGVPARLDNADEHLMIACDDAMYLAKRNGRNRVELAETAEETAPTSNQDSTRRPAAAT